MTTPRKPGVSTDVAEGLAQPLRDIILALTVRSNIEDGSGSFLDMQITVRDLIEILYTLDARVRVLESADAVTKAAYTDYIKATVT